MSHFRAARPAAAAAAVCAGACLMLSGCGGGSIAPSANGTSAASSSSSAPGSGSSTSASAGSSSSSGSSGGASGPVTTKGLTGNFCTDFNNMGQTLKGLPTPKDNGDLSAEEAIARQDMTAVEGTFNGLATEAPPNVAAALHNLTAMYQKAADDMSGVGSLGQLTQDEKNLTTDGTYLSSIETLITYATTNCH